MCGVKAERANNWKKLFIEVISRPRLNVVVPLMPLQKVYPFSFQLREQVVI